MNKRVVPLVLAAVGLIVAAEAADPPIPKGIAEFYKAWNFVSSFSTPQERRQLSPHFSTEEAKSMRLKEVSERMLRVQGQVRYVDPGINALGKRRALFPHHLLFVEDVKIAGDSALVKVRSYPVTSEDNVLLISTFERVDGQQEKLPSISDRLSILLIHKPTTEIHRWKKESDNWVKQEVNVILTD